MIHFRWKVYALTDPRTQEIRYVGYSSNLARRTREHFANRRERTRKSNWILSLFNAGLKPGCLILEEGEGKEECCAAEQKWIAHYRSAGTNLTNGTDGGDGSFGHVKSAETRLKSSLALKGRPRPPEVGHKVSEARKALGQTEKQLEALKAVCDSNVGRKRTPETLKKMSECRIGKSGTKHSDEAKKKMSMSRKGIPKSSDTRARMAAAARLRYEAEGQWMFRPVSATEPHDNGN